MVGGVNDVRFAPSIKQIIIEFFPSLLKKNAKVVVHRLNRNDIPEGILYTCQNYWIIDAALRILLRNERTRHKFQKFQTFKMKLERVRSGTEDRKMNKSVRECGNEKICSITHPKCNAFKQCLLKLRWSMRNKLNTSLKSSVTTRWNSF
jgi:hypothetical protein